MHSHRTLIQCLLRKSSSVKTILDHYHFVVSTCDFMWLPTGAVICSQGTGLWTECIYSHNTIGMVVDKSSFPSSTHVHEADHHTIPLSAPNGSLSLISPTTQQCAVQGKFVHLEEFLPTNPWPVDTSVLYLNDKSELTRFTSHHF